MVDLPIAPNPTPPKRPIFSLREIQAREGKALRFRTNLALGAAVAIGVGIAFAHGGETTVSIAAFGAALGLGGVLGFLFGIPGNAKQPVNIGTVNAVAVSGDQEGAIGTGGRSQTLNADPRLAMRNPLPAPTAIDDAKKAAPPPVVPAPPVAQPGRTSNLEQVADWVTKLLLGGGLTQMQRIPPKVWQWAHIVAIGVLRNEKGVTDQMIAAEQAFAAGLLVYGFLLGFFAGFLITKLQLGSAISD